MCPRFDRKGYSPLFTERVLRSGIENHFSFWTGCKSHRISCGESHYCSPSDGRTTGLTQLSKVWQILTPHSSHDKPRVGLSKKFHSLSSVVSFFKSSIRFKFQKVGPFKSNYTKKEKTQVGSLTTSTFKESYWTSFGGVVIRFLDENFDTTILNVGTLRIKNFIDQKSLV